MALRLDPETELGRLLDDLKPIDKLFEQRQGLFSECLRPASEVHQQSATEVENLWSGVAQQIQGLIADVEETDIPAAEAQRNEIAIALQAHFQALRTDAEALDTPPR